MQSGGCGSRSSGGSGRLCVRNEVAVGVPDGDVANAVVVGLDRLVLDARGAQPLEKLVEAGHGEGDVSAAGGSRVGLDEERRSGSNVPEDLVAGDEIGLPAEESLVPLRAGM